MPGKTHDVQYAIVTTDTSILPHAGRLHNVRVIVATATNIITMRNGLTAAGDIVLSIPASTAIGVSYECHGIWMDTGLFADFTGTGTLIVAYSVD